MFLDLNSIVRNLHRCSGLLRWLAVASPWLLVGCGMVSPFQPPKMVYSMASNEGAPAPLLLPKLTLRQELQETTIPAGAIGPHAVNDNAYLIPDHTWITKSFLPYYVHLKTQLGLHHATEGFDCDNFAALLKQELAFANRRSAFVSQGDVPCALMKVQQVEAFGAVPSLGEDYHSLNLIRTSEGWYVIEPQDASIVRLDNYPNRTTIVDLYF